MLLEVKKIKVLNTVEAVNEHLADGWRILKIIAHNCYIVGRA